MVASSYYGLDFIMYPFYAQILGTALLTTMCCRITSNTAELFCPHCGNRTLVKVSVLLDENGAPHYCHLSNKQFSHKGLRVSHYNVVMLSLEGFVFC